MSESEPEEEGEQDASQGEDAEFRDDQPASSEGDQSVGDSEDDSDVVAPGYANKKKGKGKNGNGKKVSKKLELPRGFDADLYGLRRSVSRALTSVSWRAY
jgi:hypothetical protein